MDIGLFSKGRCPEVCTTVFPRSDAAATIAQNYVLVGIQYVCKRSCIYWYGLLSASKVSTLVIVQLICMWNS